MRIPRRQSLRLAAGAAALLAASPIARAQTYPSHPITMIVPAAAGGGSDVTARIVGESMSRTLGQQIVIENIVGAGGNHGKIMPPLSALFRRVGKCAGGIILPCSTNYPCVGDYREQLPARGTYYGAFVDPAGGSGPDCMTLAIAHKARPDDRTIIDAVREMRPPFSPTVVVDEFAELLKAYDVIKVVGDHYGGEFVKEPFRKHGISYELCKQPKSDLYRDLLPSLNSGQIVLPRHDRLVAQICGLERRTGRSGRLSIMRLMDMTILPTR
jgi:hypothetical protein